MSLSPILSPIRLASKKHAIIALQNLWTSSSLHLPTLPSTLTESLEWVSRASTVTKLTGASHPSLTCSGAWMVVMLSSSRPLKSSLLVCSTSPRFHQSTKNCLFRSSKLSAEPTRLTTWPRCSKICNFQRTCKLNSGRWLLAATDLSVSISKLRSSPVVRGHPWTSRLASYLILWKIVSLALINGLSRRMLTDSWRGWMRMDKSSFRQLTLNRSATCSLWTASKLPSSACSTIMKCWLASRSSRHLRLTMISSWQPWDSCATLRSWCLRRRWTSQCSENRKKSRSILDTNQVQFALTSFLRKSSRSRPRRLLQKRRTNRSRLQRSALSLYRPTLWRLWSRESSTATRICWPTSCTISICSRPIPRWLKSRSKCWSIRIIWSATRTTRQTSFTCHEHVLHIQSSTPQNTSFSTQNSS